jgi:gliding motility-associated-like protein
VPYINGYTAGTPLGEGASIDAKTGIISGIAPEVGRYVVAVCANEYRNGKLISIHRKDFIVNVANCDYAGAQLEPSYTFCNSLTASFQNLNNSSLNETFTWDFGDGETSNEAAPVHTYPDTGTYTLKLEVNKGQPCAAVTTAVVRVYPFFNADFSVAGGCVNKPALFTDRTSTTYGTVVDWAWNFGGDISADQNPQVTFNSIGNKNVQLIATSSKGCRDTVTKTIEITDKPFIDLSFRDTLICKGDQVQLEAFGLGNFSWTPGTAINNANTATPTVSPAAATSYIVKLDNDGCINFDTVQVRVVDGVTLQIRPDSTICTSDSIQLLTTSNALAFQWSPAAGLNNAAIQSPTAAPGVNTTYQLTATIGGCSATDEVQVNLAPYPVVNAGQDTLICFNSPARLNGSTNAQQFAWTPSAPLSDNSLSPFVRPSATQAFVLTATNITGCLKPARDTVIVGVLPPVNAYAGNDTAVIIGQPLQLAASGGITYRWIPALGLSNAEIANPMAIYDGAADSIRYVVVVADEAGCVDTASMVVRVFKTAPGIFVPSAFTPNSDGNNDIFRPVPVAMSRINYFRVYNRWGELVFQSTDGRSGWDGRINGILQATGTFVWLVQGEDYTGKKFSSKGTVTLIR